MSAIMQATAKLRSAVRAAYLAPEGETVRELIEMAALDPADRSAISARAAGYVRAVRSAAKPGIMETFLAEYGLSTQEGVALMCLAEALLRVPDASTIDALIRDKIAPADWGRHLGRSSSSLVNASTWGLMLAGRALSPAEEAGLLGGLRGVVRRLGEPVTRVAVEQAMRELGRQFVLGRTIDEATGRACAMEKKGYSYSYDMLGEAARTEADARRYIKAYAQAIESLSKRCDSDDIRDNPGISVKLSALHPRYEYGQREAAIPQLIERTAALARMARAANMGFNVDAEEADRLDLSLDVFEGVLADPALAEWDGFGVVVQAYGPRAAPTLDWLYDLAQRLDRRIMARLVKGAYWDTEIKRAQVIGLEEFPVYTRKQCTDVSYIACARKLLGMRDRIYPQFATHNAHTVAAILHMSDDLRSFEFQRLHGMGESLHAAVMAGNGSRCRIYAPVGAHEDLLAYLVRRLLENGANSSFVNQIVNEEVSPEKIAQDPFDVVAALGEDLRSNAIVSPAEIFGKRRRNAKGWDLTDPATVAALDADRGPFRAARWRAGPMLAVEISAPRTMREIRNPADPADVVGEVAEASEAHVAAAVGAAVAGQAAWAAGPAAGRAAILERIADLYETHAPELMAIAAREAGKTPLDCVAEVREAVDFLRYYAIEARRLSRVAPAEGRGVFACISPWNFPLAIFTGQISAALVAGNAVVAKPAEQTPLIAARAVALMREAGVPAAAIQLLPGDGPTVGGPLTADPRIAGVCFTGSTETAQRINRAVAAGGNPAGPLIAETGGLNAMIVDSTALPEQAVRDVLASAFQSAGQRCSALRILYVQSDVEDRLLEMLFGAMDVLQTGDPWELSTDIGPVIDVEARDDISAYCARMEAEGRLLKKLTAPETGHFIAPAVYRVSGIGEMKREIFGPILHVASFEAEEIDKVIADVNARGYGLTFGLHTRVEHRVQRVVDQIHAGNLYINRNQIGAVVGSQPFGGEGLSGTGPKAGGPHYLGRFTRPVGEAPRTGGEWPTVDVSAPDISTAAAQSALDKLKTSLWANRSDRVAALSSALGAGSSDDVCDALRLARLVAFETQDLPGPTGESNRLTAYPRGICLCLGAPGAADCADIAAAQAVLALGLGCGAVIIAPGAKAAARKLAAANAPVAMLDGAPDSAMLADLTGFAMVAVEGGEGALRPVRQALAGRSGALIPLAADRAGVEPFLMERAICIDTTAAGGNTALMASATDD